MVHSYASMFIHNTVRYLDLQLIPRLATVANSHTYMHNIIHSIALIDPIPWDTAYQLMIINSGLFSIYT